MYRWASAQQKLILIAGHTHRPVWSSRTHLQILEETLKAAEDGADAETPTGKARIAVLKEQIERRAAETPSCNDPVDTGGFLACYFNTGCCRFDDGDITGIELEDGDLRLVKWTSGSGRKEAPLTRRILEEGRLADFFETLPG